MSDLEPKNNSFCIFLASHESLAELSLMQRSLMSLRLLRRPAWHAARRTAQPRACLFARYCSGEKQANYEEIDGLCRYGADEGAD
jgi:hypothetical protein